MTSKQVKELIGKEIDGNWSITNDYGVDLKACLVEPEKIMCLNSFDNNKKIQLWLVLE